MGSILFSLFILIIFIYLLSKAVHLEDLREVDFIGSSSIPIVIISLIIILTLISLIIESVKYFKSSGKASHLKLSKKTISILISLTIILVIFISVLNKIGFIISCFLMLPFLLIILGEKNKFIIILMAIFIPIIFSILFGLALNIPLPRGVSVFHDISRIFY